MKKKKWIFLIILGVVLLTVLIIFLVKIFKKEEVDDSLIKIKTNMIENLNNFSYDSLVSASFYGAKTDINLNCKEDRVNKLGYCYVTSNFVNIEEYIDYNNKATYTKSDLISSFNNSNEWKKEVKEVQDVPMLKMGYKMILKKKEKTNDGVLYSGVVNGNSFSSMMKSAGQASSKLNVLSSFGKKVPIQVFVNNNNNIEYINSDFSVLGIKITINVKFHDFNNTSSITLPGEVNGL